MSFNEYEVEEMPRIIDQLSDRDSDDVAYIRPYAVFLEQWMRTVNRNSDGWAYVPKYTRPADELCAQLGKVKDYIVTADSRKLPVKEDLDSATKPIIRAAKRYGLDIPALVE